MVGAGYGTVTEWWNMPVMELAEWASAIKDVQSEEVPKEGG